MARDRMEKLTDFVDGIIERSRRDLADFAAKLQKTDEIPYELSWSGGTFEAAGRLTAALTVRSCLEKNLSFEEIGSVVTERVMHGARWPERSTSPVSCFMFSCTTAGWGEIAAHMKDLWQLTQPQ